MNKTKYLTWDAIRFSLKMFRKHSFFLFKLSIVAGLFLWGIISLIYAIKQGSIPNIDFARLLDTLRYLISGEFAFLLKPIEADDLICFSIVAGIITLIGISEIIAIKTAVMLYDNQPISFKNVFIYWKQIPTYLALGFLLFYISKIASHFMIGLGFLIEALCKLYKYFLIDKNTNVSQAFKHSWKISKNHFIDLCMAWVMMICLIVVSSTLTTILCISIMNYLVIFIIVCYATFTCLFINACVYAFFYRKLLEEKQIELTHTNVIVKDLTQIQNADKEILPI